jgi:hypothetical protein
MKASLTTCLFLLPLGLWAQGTAEAPAIAEAGPHHRVLQWTTTEPDEAGKSVTVPHQITELATGLNWLNPLTRRWEETGEAFELMPHRPKYGCSTTTAYERASLPTMERPVRKRLPHEIPQWVSEGSFFFIPIHCVPRGLNQICQAGLGDALLDAARFNHETMRWHSRVCP